MASCVCVQLHLTDDQSFPFVSVSHPNITKYGAFDNSSVYTHADLSSLAAYAKQRGVWIQLELDLPAHAASWRGDYDFAWCSNKPNTPAVPGGGLPNPTLESTFTTLGDLYKELAPLVQSGSVAGRIHLGGDEVRTHKLKMNHPAWPEQSSALFRHVIQTGQVHTH